MDACVLDRDGEHVAAVIAGYAARKLIQRSKCDDCKQLCQASDDEKHQKEENEYLNNLSSLDLDLDLYVAMSSLGF